MKGDWVILGGLPCPLNLKAPQACSGDLGIEDVDTFSLITSSDLVVKEDALTIVRIVGELDHLLTVRITAHSSHIAQTRMYSLHEGIYVATDDSQGNILGLDPRVILDMESDCWMWQRHRRVAMDFDLAANATTNLTVGFHDSAGWNANMADHIDLRVKRKLKQGMELIYGCAWTKDGTLGDSDLTVDTEAPTWTPHLRGYVKF